MSADPQLHAVKYAFDAAFQRLCEADGDDPMMAEISNLLHHLYRLRELCFDRLASFGQTERSAPDLRAARGASWARNADTHQLFRLASGLEAVYSGFYMARYGVPVWVPRVSVPQAPDNQDRYVDYQVELEGKAIPDTLRFAFDALAALL